MLLIARNRSYGLDGGWSSSGKGCAFFTDFSITVLKFIILGSGTSRISYFGRKGCVLHYFSFSTVTAPGFLIQSVFFSALPSSCSLPVFLCNTRYIWCPALPYCIIEEYYFYINNSIGVLPYCILKEYEVCKMYHMWYDVLTVSEVLLYDFSSKDGKGLLFTACKALSPPCTCYEN